MSKKIRVIFKDGKQYALVLWLKLNNKFIMVSHTLMESYYQQFYPHGKDFHRHEIYFKNGDFHSSFKFYDEHHSLFIDRKIYPDAIVIWSSPFADFKVRCLDKLPRDNHNQDNSFVNFPLNAWNEPVVGHSFGSLAYRYNFNGLRHFHQFDMNEFDQANDILIDLSYNKDQIVNVTAVFYKNGHPYLGDFAGINTPAPPTIKTISVADFNASALIIFAPQKRTSGEKWRYFKAFLFSVFPKWLLSDLNTLNANENS